MNDSLHPNWVEGFHPTYAANVFTAAANESISAVGFSNPSENYGGELESVDYQIDVYLDHAGPYPEKPNYSLAVSVKTALLYAGYYTVELPKKVPVKKGQKFMIVLFGAIRGIWGAYIGIERPDAGYSSVTAEPGQGYVSYDGKTYEDLTEVKALNYNTHQMEPLENTSLCIKAYASYGINSVAKFPEAGMPSKEDIVWSFTNENASSVLVKPVALLYRAIQDSPVAFGDEVTGDYCLDSAGQHQQMIDGWVEVDPNDTITVHSRQGVLAGVDRVAYRYHLTDFDRSFDFVSDWRFWDRHHCPRVISTDPGNNARINRPLSMITVVFDKDINAGPAWNCINVTTADAPYETKVVFTSAFGSRLVIGLSSPILVPQDSSPSHKVWNVHIPADAVTDTHSRSLPNDHDWSFIMAYQA